MYETGFRLDPAILVKLEPALLPPAIFSFLGDILVFGFCFSCVAVDDEDVAVLFVLAVDSLEEVDLLRNTEDTNLALHDNSCLLGFLRFSQSARYFS